MCISARWDLERGREISVYGVYGFHEIMGRVFPRKSGTLLYSTSNTWSREIRKDGV